MKICMIAEGCYPYVVGGVSSWIQMMMTGLESYDFEIYTIAAEVSQKGQFKYEFPVNMKAIHENFLLEGIVPNKKGKKKKRIPVEQAECLARLVTSADSIPWKRIYEIIHSEWFDIEEYLGGYDFYDAAVERYKRDGVMTGFSDYLWTLRSMYMPLLILLSKDIPKADLYHSASAGYAGIIGAIGSAIYEKPFILSEHGIYTREREEELIRSKWTQGFFKEMWIRYFYTLSQFAYEQAGTVVSLFGKNAMIQRELGCPKEKIVIIPNGIAASDYEGTPWRKTPNGFIDIGAIVRVTPIKDIKTMLAAFKEVQNKIKNARFHILGPYDEDMEYYAECLSLMEQLNLQNCEMPGRVNISDYLADMDIMVLTSISEGQPLAILEGMICRKPWVSTNVGSCSELLNGMEGDHLGKAGLIVPVMDAVGIARAVIKLADNERLRLDMGDIGYQRTAAFYKKEDMFDRYDKIYKDYLGLNQQDKRKRRRGR